MLVRSAECVGEDEKKHVWCTESSSKQTPSSETLPYASGLADEGDELAEKMSNEINRPKSSSFYRQSES